MKTNIRIAQLITFPKQGEIFRPSLIAYSKTATMFGYEVEPISIHQIRMVPVEWHHNLYINLYLIELTFNWDTKKPLN